MASECNDGGDTAPLHGDLMFSGNFPRGLRVLVVDEDPASLLSMESQLLRFHYQVTKCSEVDKAKSVLANNKDMFDIVILVQNSELEDISNFLQRVGFNPELPVIVISADNSVESVVKALADGACDILLKPVPPETLRMIYKYVAAKRVVKDTDNSSSKGESSLGNSRKRLRSVHEGDDHDDITQHASKKRRVVWSSDLRDKFLSAVNTLGDAKAVPKKILERMNVPYLTRENVASHLQKFRIQQKKKKEKEEAEQRKRSFVNTQQEGNNLYYRKHAAMFTGTPTPTPIYRTQPVQFPHHHMNLVLGMNPMMSHHHNHHHHAPLPGRNDLLQRQQVSEFASDHLGNYAEEDSIITSDNTEGSEMMMGLIQNENHPDMVDEFHQLGFLPDWRLEDNGFMSFSEHFSPSSQDLSSFQGTMNPRSGNVETPPTPLEFEHPKQ